MKNFYLLQSVLFVLALLVGPAASAQLAVPLPAITLANSGLPAVTISLNGILRDVLPTPFIIADPALPLSAQWFCMDPLQAIFYAGSGEPAGNSLQFAGTNPANFDLWGANAPGLTAARVQNLADLFTAYLPLTNTSLGLGALQLAVWEIANEANANAFSLAGGFLTAVPYNGSGAAGMIATANAMVASLANVAIMNRGNLAAVDFLIDGTYRRIGTTTTVLVQDLVGFTPVPEPAAYGWAGVGMLAVLIGYRRFRNAKTAPAVAA